MNAQPSTRSIFWDFLLNGRLGALGCGMTKADVEHAIGKPERVEDYPGDRAVWCFWPAEVRFCDEQVSVFGVYFEWWQGSLPGWLQSRGYFPARGTSMSVVQNFLKESGTQFEVGERWGGTENTSRGLDLTNNQGYRNVCGQGMRRANRSFGQPIPQESR